MSSHRCRRCGSASGSLAAVAAAAAAAAVVVEEEGGDSVAVVGVELRFGRSALTLGMDGMASCRVVAVMGCLRSELSESFESTRRSTALPRDV